MNMTKDAQDYDVLRPTDSKYAQYIEQYWNWLLSDNPKDDPIYKGTFFMRACYDYAYTESGRQNLCGIGSQAPKYPLVNSIGSRRKPFPVSISKTVLLPLIDSVFHDKILSSQSGEPLTPAEMDTNLNKENNAIPPGDVSATISRIDPPPHYTQDIVPSPHTYMSGIVPFSLKIPDNSSLADKMEWEFPRGTVKARSKGMYLALKFNNKGTYEIVAKSHGSDNYQAFMHYIIKVI
jgi:hypothetical protein